MNIEVYSDGSATTLANAGGWASVVVVDGKTFKELSGHMPSATNNDAELQASVGGLEYVYNLLIQDQEPQTPLSVSRYNITLVSDSEIILNWANGKYRFKQLDKIEQYNKLRALVLAMKVQTRWVKGHSGDQYNERCDYLANLARKNLPDTKNSTPTDKAQSAIGTKKQGVGCVWFKDKLFVLDFEQKIMEEYNRDVHGKRGSPIEMRDGRTK